MEGHVIDDKRCKHGMVLSTCSFCSLKVEGVRAPSYRDDKTDFGGKAVCASEITPSGFVAVRGIKNHPSLNLLSSRTKAVHILGHPFYWLIELILDRAPSVRVVQVIPTMLIKIGPRHRALCEAHGVKIAGGHVRPEMVWAEDEVRHTRDFLAQQSFLKNLQGKQKALFDELVAFGFDAAIMTVRYYNLDDAEKEVTQQELADEYGFCDNRQISMQVNAVLYYLDPLFPAGERSIQFAEMLKRRVAKLREYFKAISDRQAIAEKLGLKSLPDKMPLARIETLVALIEEMKKGRLSVLEDAHRLDRVLVLRFGLDNLDNPRYRMLREVGEILGGISRERVRQLERDALAGSEIFDGEFEE